MNYTDAGKLTALQCYGLEKVAAPAMLNKLLGAVGRKPPPMKFPGADKAKAALKEVGLLGSPAAPAKVAPQTSYHWGKGVNLKKPETINLAGNDASRAATWGPGMPGKAAPPRPKPPGPAEASAKVLEKAPEVPAVGAGAGAGAGKPSLGAQAKGLLGKVPMPAKLLAGGGLAYGGYRMLGGGKEKPQQGMLPYYGPGTEGLLPNY